MPSFHNDRLPGEVESGARGGPGFKTTVLTSNSGAEQRNIEWERARHRWDISFGIRDKADLVAVRKHFYARYGRAYGFPFLDLSDYNMPRQTIGIGNGVTTIFPIFKEYESGGETYLRYLTRFVPNTMSVWVNGVLLASSGQFYTTEGSRNLVFDPSSIPGNGQIIEVQTDFYVPVRYDQDELNVQAIIEDETDPDEGLEGISSIVIVELKE